MDVAVEEDLSQKKMENIPKWPDGILDYLDETERNKVLEYACNLQISQSTRLHKMLVQYKKDIADYKSKLKEAQSRPCYNPRHNKPENEPAFFKEMSDECMSRAIAILDEYLGKRQHEKSAEEKEKSLQDSIRKSWYW